MTARTILEHTDDILALPSGAWLIVTAPIWGTPDEGGRVDIPTGTHLRVAWSIGEHLETHTADARSMTIRRDQLAHVERLLSPVRACGPMADPAPQALTGAPHMTPEERAELVKRLSRTPLYDGSGDETSLGEDAADEITRLSAEREALRSQNAALKRERTSIITTHRENLALAEKTASELRAEVERLREALEWYAEPVLAYAVTQFNEPRSAVHADGGRRARAALTPEAKS